MFAIPRPEGRRGLSSAARRRRPFHVLAVLAASCLAACSVGGSGSSSSLGDDDGGGGGGGPDLGDAGVNGDDGGETASPLSNGDAVTFLETEAPPEDVFVLRGTFPVPPGVFPRSDGQMHFSIVDHTGAQRPTQNEVVTHWADPDDGADVVEVIALVPRPSVSPGTRIQYEVRQVIHGSTPSPGSPGPEDLTNATQSLPQGVLNLLGQANAIRISARDVFGNEYACYPLDGTGTAQVEKYGSVLSQVQISQNMEPEPVVPGSQGTLEHFLGVHSYLTTMQGEDVVLFDVRFHNAHSGRSTSDDGDDPLDRVYFEEIEISLPSGWVLQQDVVDPYFGTPFASGGRTVCPVVEPLGDGTMHVIRWQGQFHRRLALSPAATSDRARMYLDGYGRGFCRRGTDPTDGHEYWSWWNAGTDRYFPANHQLPSLEHVGHASVRASLGAELATLRGYIENGTSHGDYPVQAGVLGWGHPYGVPYGGMTAGLEIYMLDGVRAAEAASREGYRLFEVTHRMHTDRQPNVLYDLDGEPSSVERWKENGPNGPYVPFECYGMLYGSPFLRPDDPFGFDQAEQFQIQAAESGGKQPYYEAAHLSFDAHDIQHLIRYTRSPKALTWLGNDAMAKDDLRAQAEIGHLSYHPYDNNPFGGQQPITGLATNLAEVAAAPGKGFNFGRGESWILDAMTATYACASLQWRQDKRPWFDTVAGLLSDGQGTCNGFIQSIVRPKILDSTYHGRQAIEQAITENAVRGMRETVYRDADAARTAMLGEVLADSTWAFVGPMAWFPGEPAPWTHTANGPLDPDAPIFCSQAEMLANSGTWNPMYENYQNWASFAYGYDVTGEELFLEKARTQLGASDLLSGLEASGTSNIWNQAPLLALAQRLAGEL